MTKMKKLFAVVLALAMLFTMASFSVMAEGEEPVSLTVSPSSVNYNGGMRVSLNVDNSVVGGVQTTITYDEDAVKLVSKSLTNTTSNTLANTVLDDGNGNIKVVALGGGVVFEFVVLESNTKTTATFTAEDLKASNLAGDGYVAVNEAALTADATISTDKTTMPVMMGTKLRANNDITKQDLGFVAQIANKGAAKISKIGLIVIPTAILTSNDVALEDFTAENEALAGKVLSAELTGDDAESFTSSEFVGYIKDTVSYKLMGKSFTARYYVQLEGSEDIIYSTNFTTSVSGEITASYGTTKNSVVKLLGTYIKAIAANANATEEVKAQAEKVISDYNAAKDDTNKQALLDFVAENKDLL